ncbi:XylR N-terminal domain-containing protein [Dehalobacter sp. DCM]|uniref:XylR N-terminal domain-containing protein n=1 Tax=Dehalobacter sp. DCM TaxID=2907827 RepID=UPI003081C031|nr:XylR N-terminal domain-containing protein [Dehalobacter sp. DCM]
MRAVDLRLEELIQIMPEQGKIFLAGSRVTLFDAYAFGKLRKDLIENLGIDRAKGFLVRYGWSCGYQFAMNLKDKFEWDNELEWTFTGPIMHRLTGFVSTQPNEEDFDPKTGIWFRNAIWRNSVEAEQHILHMGLHHEPVCWMLTGFASGYNSAYLGKRVIFKEIECVGKGDPFCTNIGKTVEDWGDEIQSELAYYEMDKISVELEEAHRRITAQNTILERSVSIHERLTECILKGKGVAEIAENLAELMKCDVIVEDHLLTLLATSVSSKYTSELPSRFYTLQSSPEFNKNITFFKRRTRTFEIVDHYQDVPVHRLICPIIVRSQLLGYVSLLRVNATFAEIDRIGLEHAASVVAVELLKENEIADTENRIRGDFLEDLLAGNYTDSNSIISRARALDYDITAPHRVLYLGVHNFNELVRCYKQDEKKIMQFKDKLADCVRISLKELGKVVVLGKSNDLILLIPLKDPEVPEKDTRELAEQIIHRVSKDFPKINMTIGVGSLCLKLEDYKKSLYSAKKAVDICKNLNKKGKAVSLEQLGTHALLFSSLNPEDMQHFARQQIGSLVEHDEKYQTKLIPTLEELLNQCGNVLSAARALNLSVSGLKYRLNLIEEITGLDLRDSKDSFNMRLALIILRLTEGSSDEH